MSMIQAFSTGFRRAISEPKMVFVVYLVNLLLVIPMVLAFRSVLVIGIGDSLATAQLMDGLNFTVFQDFMASKGESLLAVVRQWLPMLVVSMLLQTFLAGGILALVQDQERKFEAPAFFKGCGTYFWRFFKLFLIFGVLLTIVTLLMSLVVGMVAVGISDNATSEVTAFWAWVAALIVLLIPVAMILMAADYARIHVVLHDERSALRSSGHGLAFMFRRFFAVWGLELMLLMIPLALFALYFLVDLSVGMTSEATIVMMFVVQQLFMMLRAWTKILFYGSELTLYRGLQKIPFPERFQ